LAEDAAEGNEFIYDYAGVPVRYTSVNGITIRATAVIDYQLQEYGTVADVSAATATVSVRFKEVPARPRRQDTYEILEGALAGTVYTVDNILRADELEHVALVS